MIKMTVGKKLGVGFGVLLMFLVILGAVVLFNVNNMDRHFEFVIKHDVPVMSKAEELRKLVVDKGTGLGLFIIHSIIEKHGGVVDIESEVGKGTAFIIRLPLA